MLLIVAHCQQIRLVSNFGLNAGIAPLVSSAKKAKDSVSFSFRFYGFSKNGQV